MFDSTSYEGPCLLRKVNLNQPNQRRKHQNSTFGDSTASATKACCHGTQTQEMCESQAGIRPVPENAGQEEQGGERKASSRAHEAQTSLVFPSFTVEVNRR